MCVKVRACGAAPRELQSGVAPAGPPTATSTSPRPRIRTFCARTHASTFAISARSSASSSFNASYRRASMLPASWPYSCDVLKLLPRPKAPPAVPGVASGVGVAAPLGDQPREGVV